MDKVNKVSFEEYVRRALNHARFRQNEDASWTVEVPILPGCISWGATRAEALEMIKDAIEAWVITALRFCDKIPPIDECYLQYAIDEREDVKITSRKTERSHPKAQRSGI